MHSGGALLVRVTDRAPEREPNRLLAQVMAEAGVSNKGLAARVRELARRDGHQISSDHVSVRRWLDGRVPRGRTPEYIARALSIKIGRRVTPADLGFSDVYDDGISLTHSGTCYPDACGDAINLLIELAAMDSNDHHAILELQPYPDATPQVITSYLFGQPNALVAASDRDAQSPTAAAIRGTAAHLMDLDFVYGGGQVRKLLLFYFKSEVIPTVRKPAPEAVRRDLYSAAAEVAQLLGWCAYDVGRHGAAQRYFVLGLRLAREARDHMLGGRLLSNISHQANYLGKFGDAAQFARAAQSITPHIPSATVSAMFFAMEARALASIGDERGCAAALNEAEALFARGTCEADPEWIRYFNAEELAGETAHCFRDLGHSAHTRLFADQAMQPVNTPPRTRAFIGMVKAAGILTCGDADEAVALGLSAVDLAGPLRSQRYVRYLLDFYRALSTRSAYRSFASAFADRVRNVYPDVKLPIGPIG